MPYADADGDLFANTDDNCPDDPNELQLDFDHDGVGDECDGCAADTIKSVGPGDCGCDEPDIDITGDGVSDCGLDDPALRLLSTFGLLLVADTTNDRIMAFDPFDGDLVDPDFIPADPVNLAYPIAAILGPNHNTVLVTDATRDAVQEFDLNGNFIRTFAPAGGANQTVMDDPRGLAWRPNGNLVVCVGSGANADAIVEFDSDGNFVGNFVSNGLLGLDEPRDILFHSNGIVYVTDETDRIKLYNADGTMLNAFSALLDSGVVLQWLEAANGDLIGTSIIGGRRGIVRFISGEFPEFVEQKAPIGICNFFGVAELLDGGFFVTGQPIVTGNEIGGAFQIDADGELVRTVFRGHDLGVVERVIRDSDGDGAPDGFDGCPNDADKVEPGDCGCGVDDADGDGDTIADCHDQCPGDDDLSDTDEDGTPDCLDGDPGNPTPPTDGDSNPQDDPGPQDVPTEDCCGGGVTMMAPLFLIGWRRRRGGVRRETRFLSQRRM